MTNVTAQEVQQYLVDHDYLKPDELAKRTGTTTDQILALEAPFLMPLSLR